MRLVLTRAHVPGDRFSEGYEMASRYKLSKFESQTISPPPPLRPHPLTPTPLLTVNVKQTRSAPTFTIATGLLSVVRVF